MLIVGARSGACQRDPTRHAANPSPAEVDKVRQGHGTPADLSRNAVSWQHVGSARRLASPATLRHCPLRSGESQARACQRHRSHSGRARRAGARAAWGVHAGCKALNARPAAAVLPEGWCLYLIECRNGAWYAGITNRLDARYAAHVAGRGARYTRGNPPVKLLGFRSYADRASASRAEWQIKQLPRGRKLAFLRDK